MLDCQRTEIFIESYQNAIFLMSMSQDRFITRIAFPLSSPHDIVSGRSECRTHEYARHAGVQ